MVTHSFVRVLPRCRSFSDFTVITEFEKNRGGHDRLFSKLFYDCWKTEMSLYKIPNSSFEESDSLSSLGSVSHGGPEVQMSPTNHAIQKHIKDEFKKQSKK